MNFSLTPEQELLREAARTALSRIDTIAGARAALDGTPLPELWPTAVQAGWQTQYIDVEKIGWHPTRQVFTDLRENEMAPGKSLFPIP